MHVSCSFSFQEFCPESPTRKQDESKAKGDDSNIPSSDLDSEPLESGTDDIKLKEENLALICRRQVLEEENIDLMAAKILLASPETDRRDRKVLHVTVSA